MPSEHTKSKFRGLLLPDFSQSTTPSGNVNAADVIWTAQSGNLTQAGNFAGVPDPQVETDAVLQATGDQVASTEIEILTQQGGYPGPGKAGYVWRHTASPAEDYRGWNAPNLIANWEGIEHAGSTNENLNLHAATHPDGEIFLVYEDYDPSATIHRTIHIRTRTTAGVWGSPVQIYGEPDPTVGVTDSYELNPALLVLPSGRLLCFHFVYHNANTATPYTDDIAQIRMHYSDDKGATWTTGSPYAMESEITLNTIGPLRRLRVAYGDGQILALISYDDSSLTYDSVIQQLASDDMGASFQTITTFSGADRQHTGCFGEVVHAGGYFVAAHISRQDSAGGIGVVVNRVASAYDAISAGAVSSPFTAYEANGTINGTKIDDGDLAMCVDEDGAISIYLRVIEHSAAQNDNIVIRSEDYGSTWTAHNNTNT